MSDDEKRFLLFMKALARLIRMKRKGINMGWSKRDD